MSAHEPSTAEVWLTLTVGRLLGPYYRRTVDGLPLPTGAHVLDFGSGSGVCSRYLARRLTPDGRLTCVDVSRRWQATIRRVLRRYPHVEYRCGEIWTLDLPTAGFDAIFVHFVLHDIPEHEHARILIEFVRVLKPGGCVSVREPSNPAHGMTPEAVRALFETHGFVTERCESRTAPLVGPFSDSTFSIPTG